MKSTKRVVALLAAMVSAGPSTAAAQTDTPARGHGPSAASDQFPSHVFQLAAHEPRRLQLAFHYGLSQPILLGGFNAAVDVRYRRLVLTYSHGQGLDYTTLLPQAERARGMRETLTYTTGGGVGVLLIDELWVLADVKLHHFDAEVGADRADFDTITVGGEIGWRFFLWKGFNVAFVARYWPNVWSSAGDGVVLRDAGGHSFVHRPDWQGASGFLGNILIGWAFEP